jgi:hypothetical protein
MTFLTALDIYPQNFLQQGLVSERDVEGSRILTLPAHRCGWRQKLQLVTFVTDSDGGRVPLPRTIE